MKSLTPISIISIWRKTLVTVYEVWEGACCATSLGGISQSDISSIRNSERVSIHAIFLFTVLARRLSHIQKANWMHRKNDNVESENFCCRDIKDCQVIDQYSIRGLYGCD